MKKLILLFCIFGLVTESLAQFPVPPYGRNLSRGRIAGQNSMGSTVPVLDTNYNNYYFASSGNDGDNGHSSSLPWQTITKLNTVTLVAGDSVFFNKGDTFAGQVNITQSGTAGSPITLTSYGTGAKPIIEGGIPITGWVARTDGYGYKALASAPIYGMWVDGQQYLIARTPNNGSNFWNDGRYYYPTGAVNDDTITSTQLTEASGYYNGATVVDHAVAYGYHFWPDVTWNGTVLTFAARSGYDPSATGGFYLTNNLKFLDTLREFYCNTSTDSVYIGVASDPSSKTVMGSAYDYGVFDTTKAFINIQNLEFRHQRRSAIRIVGSAATDVNMANVTVSQQSGDGIVISAGRNCRIDSSVVKDIAGNGISFASVHGTLSKDTVQRTGLVGGDGLRTNGYSEYGRGIDAYGDSMTISQNRVDSCGHGGIAASAAYILVEKNYVSWVCLNLSDAGGIYSYSETYPLNTPPTLTHHNRWEYNTVLHVGSDRSGEGFTEYGGAGLYQDHASRTSTKYNNVGYVRWQGLGFGFEQWNDTVLHNTFYDVAQNDDNQRAAIYYTSQQDSGQYGYQKDAYPLDAYIVGNIVLVKGTSRSFYIQADTSLAGAPHTEAQLGLVDSNTYIRDNWTYGWEVLYRDPPYRGSYIGGHYTTLGAWKTYMTQEANSDTLYKRLTATDTSYFFVNPTGVSVDTPLVGNYWKDIDGIAQTSPLTLAPYTSKILIKDTTPPDSSRFAVGYYTGNGADDRAITGLGFKPDIVIVKAQDASIMAVISFDSLDGFRKAVGMVQGIVYDDNIIKSRDADGFTVSDTTYVNTNGQVYIWQAWKKDTRYMQTGTNVGTGVEHSVTVGFQPDMVIWVENWGVTLSERMATMATDSAADFFHTEEYNTVKALTSNGFTIGTNGVNYGGGDTGYWIAFKKQPGYSWQGSYTGDDADPRTISGVFTAAPDLLWIAHLKVPDYGATGFLPSGYTGTAGNNPDFSGNTDMSNSIHSLTSTGFTLGWDKAVNLNGYIYHYFAWKVH